MYTSNVAVVRPVIIICRRPKETNEIMKPIHTHVLVPDVQPYEIYCQNMGLMTPQQAIKIDYENCLSKRGLISGWY